jgi:hypothetical protein
MFGGKSHSCEMPTSWSAKPSEHASSVADGRKETIRSSFMVVPWVAFGHERTVKLYVAHAKAASESCARTIIQFDIIDHARCV